MLFVKNRGDEMKKFEKMTSEELENFKKNLDAQRKEIAKAERKIKQEEKKEKERKAYEEKLQKAFAILDWSKTKKVQGDYEDFVTVYELFELENNQTVNPVG